MMSRLGLLAFSALVLIALSAEGQDSENSPIGYATVAEALQDLQNNSNADIRIENGWTVIEERSDTEMVLWTFAPEAHPAYPAAIKRRIYESDGAMWIDMNALCQAEKDPCDALVAEFEALNDQIRNTVAERVETSEIIVSIINDPTNDEQVCARAVSMSEGTFEESSCDAILPRAKETCASAINTYIGLYTTTTEQATYIARTLVLCQVWTVLGYETEMTDEGVFYVRQPGGVLP